MGVTGVASVRGFDVSVRGGSICRLIRESVSQSVGRSMSGLVSQLISGLVST